MKIPAIVFLAAVVLSAAAGCTNKTTLSGQVTYDGQPVENGAITLLPADGKGPSAGGPIKAGRYRVEQLTPGKKIVQVIGVKDIEFARSSEEMARFAETTDFQTNRHDVLERADMVPADAEGNFQEITVEPGQHTMDFHLTPPG